MKKTKYFNAETCTEVFIILTELELIDKLPEEIKLYIEKNKSTTYKFRFREDIPLIYQISNNETKTLLSYLYLKYINKSEYEKKLILKKYEENQRIYTKKINEQYDPDNIFKNRKNKSEYEDVKKQKNERALVEYKESIIKKILNKILKFFKGKK